MLSLDTYYSSSQFKGTSGTNIGREGYVPQAQIGESGNYLRGDGKWIDFGLSNLTSSYTTLCSNSGFWEKAIYNVYGTSNQIVATNAGTNNHNNQVTLSFAQSAVFPGDVLIPGTLTVTGSATYINTKNLVVDDPIIFLANNNPGNLVDTGFVSHFKLGPPLNNTHAGLVRRANQGVPGYWTLFSGLTTEPLTSVNIDWNDKNIKLDTLSANIATNNGTSDQWNSVYTTVNSNSGNYILDGGNTKTANIVIGTNDAYSLNLETNNTNRVTILSSGEVNINFIPIVNGIVGSLSSVGNVLDVRGTATAYSEISSLTGLSALSGSSPGQFSAGGMLIGQNEGGAYIGRVNVRENSWQILSGTEGVNWSERVASFYNEGIDISADGKIIVATPYLSQLKASYDYGVTWVNRGPNTTWTCIAISLDGKIMLAGAETGLLWTSYDYGVTWVSRASTKQWNSVAVSSDGRIQTAVEGFSVDGNIWTSYDYGVTWTSRASSRRWRDIAMSSDGRIQTAVISSGQIWTSFDYGVTWTSRASSRSWEGVTMSADGRVQTAVINGGNIWTSYDYGVTWTSRASSRAWYGVTMSADGRVQTAVVLGGQIWTSHDYGVTWIGRASSKNWSCVAMSSDGRIQACGIAGSSGAGIWVSNAITITPNPITVLGTISATSVVYASGGNSDQWNSNWTSVNSNSANWILDGGNTKGSNISIGTNDDFNFTIKQNNVSRIALNADGSTRIDSDGGREILISSTGHLSALASSASSNIIIAANHPAVPGVVVIQPPNVTPGKVGIGTLTPNEALTVVGTISTNKHNNSSSWAGFRSTQTSNFSATPGSYYIVNTTSTPITGYLPQSPVLGTTITFQDSFIQWQTNNFTLNRSGNMIQGLNEDMICDRGGVMFDITYIGGSIGWRVN